MDTHNTALIVLLVVISIFFVVSIIKTILSYIIQEDRLLWTAISVCFLTFIIILSNFLK